jgi:hypothetical protein
MKHYIIAAFLLPLALALLQGCKRKAPDDAVKASNDAPSETKAESGVEMVQLPGGWFTMGDEKMHHPMRSSSAHSTRTSTW